MSARTQRFEFSTVGFDPGLQLVGSDALRGAGWTGLQVPAAVPLTRDARYTLLTAVASFGQGEFATLVGIRQLVTLFACVSTGVGLPNFPLICNVETPNWRFVDGNIMWSLRRLRPSTPGFYNRANADGLQWRMGSSPTQLFETLPAGAPILPPYRGIIPGETLEPNLMQFYDIRFPWTSDEASHVLKTPIVGPCTVGLFASVLQTNPATRITMPGTKPFSMDTGITKEDAFVGNYSDCARYGSVAGALIFEKEIPRKTVSDRAFWGQPCHVDGQSQEEECHEH